MNFSVEDLTMIALLLDEDEKKEKISVFAKFCKYVGSNFKICDIPKRKRSIGLYKVTVGSPLVLDFVSSFFFFFKYVLHECRNCCLRLNIFFPTRLSKHYSRGKRCIVCRSRIMLGEWLADWFLGYFWRIGDISCLQRFLSFIIIIKFCIFSVRTHSSVPMLLFHTITYTHVLN